MKTEHKIFVVDDDPGFRKTLSDILKIKGFDAVAIGSGKVALERLEKEIPVVALIDLRLEDMSGLKLMRAIKERIPGTACIVLTGHADQSSAIEALNSGAYGYMQKPYDVEQLLVMIRRAVEMWDAEESLREYAERLKNLHKIDQAILEARSSNAIAQAALDGIRQLIPCQLATITAFNSDTNETTLLAIYVNNESEIEISDQLIHAFPVTKALRQGNALIIENINTISDLSHSERELVKEGIHAYISMPLVAQNGLIGVLGLASDRQNEFLPEHIEIAREVADQLTVAIQQARLNEQIQHDAIELEKHVQQLQQAQASEREQRELAETLSEVTGILNKTLDLEAVLQTILQQLARVVSYDDASVMLISNGELRNVTNSNAKGEALTATYKIEAILHAQMALIKQSPVIISDTKTDPRWTHILGTEHVRCWLGVPLLVQEKVIGLLGLSRKTANSYTKRDADVTMSFAAQAAIAVSNAQLFEQAQQEIGERKRAEVALEEERSSLAKRVAERTLELQAANGELARSARLKDEFLANMSHELRTPLNAILGLSEALQEEVYGRLNGKQLESLKTIEESGRLLLALINDILDVSKIEAGKLTLDMGPVSVEILCRASLALIRQTAHKKRLHISSNIDNSVNILYADQRRVKQILVNLLSNAVKFTQPGGEIGIEVIGDISNKIVHFTVWDTGIGISQDDMKRLFEPFVQLDSSLSREHMGTGLGLTLVRRLTEMHDGGISVESELNKGSRFTVSLPWRKQIETIVVDHKAKSGFREAERSIDEFTHQLSEVAKLSHYLGEMDIEALIYNQGMGALEYVLSEQPDIIILDVNLPDLSGWEVLAHLKLNSQTQNIPILIVSTVDDQTSGLTWGAAGHLVKPVSRHQLKETLEHQIPHQLAHLTRTLLIMSDHKNDVDITPLEKNGPLVLLAEDNENNVSTISNYLIAKGYRIFTAWNGEEAVVEASKIQPDIILMDIQMPEMDGLEAIRHLRANTITQTIPIIALTALVMSGDRERCLEAGANDYLSKPISLQKLTKTIESQLQASKQLLSLA